MPEIDRAALRKRISEYVEPAIWRDFCRISHEIAKTNSTPVNTLEEDDPNATLGQIPKHAEIAGLKRLAQIGAPYSGFMEQVVERDRLVSRRQNADSLLRKAAELRDKLVACVTARGARGELIASYVAGGEVKVVKPEGWVYGEWNFDSVSLHFQDGTVFHIEDIRESVPPAKTPDNAPTTVENTTPAPPEAYRTGFAGKPTARHLIEEEMRRRGTCGDLLPSLKKEADYLERWCMEKHPKAPPAKAKTIRNSLRELYRQVKAEADRR